MASDALYRLAGGESTLRAVITDFYDAVFSDLMIGFFFAKSNKARLIEKELELISEHLGAPGVHYRGRELREAHQAHPIMGGHFERRLQLLREAMARHALPVEVQEAWIAHAEGLRDKVTPMQGGDCE